MKRLCALFLTVLFLSACAPKSNPEGSGSESTSQPDPSTSSSQQQEETMEPAMALTDLGVTLENYPRINGSTSTLGIVQAVYEGAGGNMQDENYPWEPLRTVPSYEALINGEVDLILVPYASPAVREQAQQAGVELEYSQVAAEALIFITPKDNTAANITGDQVREIYLHNGISNWSELGGPDRGLVPICRNADSGSQSQMDNLILDGQAMDPTIQENYVELTMEGMLEQVAYYHSGGMFDEPTDTYALGYTLFTYLEDMDRFTGIGSELKILNYEGVAATAESIADGSYPLSDGYYAVIRADLPQDHPARAVVRWLRSQTGQEALLRQGFIPVYMAQLPPQDTEEAAREEVARYYADYTEWKIQDVELVKREGPSITFHVTVTLEDGQTQEQEILLESSMRGWSVVYSMPLDEETGN